MYLDFMLYTFREVRIEIEHHNHHCSTYLAVIHVDVLGQLLPHISANAPRRECMSFPEDGLDFFQGALRGFGEAEEDVNESLHRSCRIRLNHHKVVYDKAT